MAKFHGDVRPLSNDPLYMGQPFSGSMKNAIKQAKAASDYGVPSQDGKPAHIARDRWNLLEHLGLTRGYLERKPAKRALSTFSLQYAIARWPENFFQHKADGYNRGYQDGIGYSSVEQDF
jgi:hypothetical protein